MASITTMMRLNLCALALLHATSVSAFTPLVPNRPPSTVSRRNNIQHSTSTALAMSTPDGDGGDNDDNTKQKKKSGFDEGLRTKLLSESIAPWRTVRLFMYGSLGSGALVGGLITLSGTAAALSGTRPDLELNTQFLNLAVDFGAVAAFVALAKWDLGKQKELSEKVEDRIQQKKDHKKVILAVRAREQLLGTLELEIQVGPDGSVRNVPVRQVQAGASQHVILVVGPKKACRDALIGANLLKMDFAMSNILVVPYETGVVATELQSRPSGGFADRPMYETQPYVAQAVGEGWDDYIQAELSDAVAQNGENVKTEGIAIVVANTGKVLRRGIGKVPWRQMVEQLEGEAKAAAK